MHHLVSSFLSALLHAPTLGRRSGNDAPQAARSVMRPENTRRPWISPSSSVPGKQPLAAFQRLLEGFLHGAENLDELKLLAFRTFTVDQGPPVRLAFGDLDGVR